VKYTKEVLEPLVQESLSVAEVIKKLGLRCLNGGTHSHITNLIRRYEIGASHFLGQGRNRGIAHVGGSEKLCWSSILIKSRFGGRKESSQRLRRAMIESGIEEVCGSCGMLAKWNNKPLVLQISHKDGDSLDNERENLHFECPNCHSQTEDFGGKGAGKNSFRGSIVQ
jgi:hypothetical protein